MGGKIVYSCAASVECDLNSLGQILDSQQKINLLIKLKSGEQLECNVINVTFQSDYLTKGSHSPNKWSQPNLK